MNKEHLKIIYLALDSLETNPLLKGMWKYVVNTATSIEINFYIGDKHLKYITEVRKEIRAQQVPKLLAHPQAGQLLVVAEKIQGEAKETLVANKMAYIECNGNIFIPQKDMYVWIDSNRPRATPATSAGRAFTKSGLKVLFHFLLNEGFLTMSYRQIAEATGTSLGNITNIINSLKALNFLTTGDDGKWKLNNKKQLTEKWIDQFEHELKPAIEIGSFRFDSELDYQNWRRIPLEHKKTLWSGEPGAHLLNGMLKPVQLIIYTSETRADLMAHYRLVRDPDGYIKVYDKFWNYDGAHRGTVAPPLLVYADLLYTGDKKNLEAAERIFDDALKNTMR